MCRGLHGDHPIANAKHRSHACSDATTHANSVRGANKLATWSIDSGPEVLELYTMAYNPKFFVSTFWIQSKKEIWSDPIYWNFTCQFICVINYFENGTHILAVVSSKGKGIKWIVDASPLWTPASIVIQTKQSWWPILICWLPS